MTRPIKSSFVVPLFKSERSVALLIHTLALLPIDYTEHEFIFVDDASPDKTRQIAFNELNKSRLRYQLISHTRNYGEHNAVLTGYRHSRGLYVINLDDDLQNPPIEALRLLEYALNHDSDVVYGDYNKKMHAQWRNLGSMVANYTAKKLLSLDPSVYLSSFRCVRGSIARQIASYDGPYPYIDGLIPQYTSSIDSLTVTHQARRHGDSGYNLRRLVRLWLIIFTSFSVMPLRLASIFGVMSFIFGTLLSFGLVIDYLLYGTVAPGWTSTFCIILTVFGVQALLIGILGEYLGRVLLTVSKKPQSFVRDILKSEDH